MTNYAASERARQSRARLTVRLALQMQRWAEHRSRAWGVDRRWTPDHVVGHTNALRNGDRLARLTDAPADILALDRDLFRWLAIGPKRSPPTRATSGRKSLTTEQLWQFMHRRVPGMSRQRLRNLIGTMVRSGRIERVARGRFAIPIDDLEDWMFRRGGEPDDPAEIRWWARMERRALQDLNVVLCHYLLPHWPVHRKALRLGISERTYYYRLCSALACVADEPAEP